MPDALDILRRLESAPPAEPPPLDDLRRRVARRRRRTRGLTGLALVALVAAAGLAVPELVGDDGTSELRTAPDPAPTSAPSTTPPITAPGSSGLPASSLPPGAAVAGTDGVFVVGGDGGLVRRWDRPAPVAFAFEDLVVTQESAMSVGFLRLDDVVGPIVVIDGAGQVRELPVVGDERLRLLDVGGVGGRVVALASSSTGSGPEDAEERLVAVELSTGERTDLGAVGGWEAGVAHARLVPDGVVLVRYVVAQWWVEGRTLSGETLWSLPGPSDDDSPPSPVVLPEQATLVELQYGEGWRARVTVVGFNARTMTRSGVSIDGSLDRDLGCEVPDLLTRDRILCSDPTRAPFVLDPVTGEVGGIEPEVSGVVTMPRALPPSPCLDDQGRGDVDGDGADDVAFNHWSAFTGRSVLGVCTVAGAVLTLDVGAENISVIDIEPDGRAEVLYNGTSAITAFNGLAVVVDGALVEVRTADREPLGFDSGVLGSDDPGVAERLGAWGCADVDADGRRELVVAEASFRASTTQWVQRAYALDGASAVLVDTRSGAAEAMDPLEAGSQYVESLVPERC